MSLKVCDNLSQQSHNRTDSFKDHKFKSKSINFCLEKKKVSQQSNNRDKKLKVHKSKQNLKCISLSTSHQY